MHLTIGRWRWRWSWLICWRMGARLDLGVRVVRIHVGPSGQEWRHGLGLVRVR